MEDILDPPQEDLLLDPIFVEQLPPPQFCCQPPLDPLPPFKGELPPLDAPPFI